MLAAARRGEGSAPDVSVAGARVFGRQVPLPTNAPPAANLPTWWPGTTPSRAFVARQLKFQAMAATHVAPTAVP
jgi:hypothetical protein